MDEIRNNFEQYIMGIEIPDDMNQKDESKIISELFEYCKEITPSNLFRYRSCSDYHIEAFEKDQLWLSKPTTFNDPHDSYLFIDRKKILNQVINNSSTESSFEHIEKLLNDKEFRKQEIKRLGQEFVDRIIKNATVNGSPIRLNQDQLDAQNKYHEHRIDLIIDLAKKSMKQASLVACFSETITSTLMWAHYSSNHKGFALNYNLKSMYNIDIGRGKTRGSLFVDNKLFPILYTDKRYDATYYVEFHFMDDFYRHLGLKMPYPFYDKLFYYKSLLFKSDDWTYEKEWRMIRQTDNNLENKKPDYAHMGNIKVMEIYLGSEISESDRLTLCKVARKKKLKIYQMEVDDSERAFKMKYFEIK